MCLINRSTWKDLISYVIVICYKNSFSIVWQRYGGKLSDLYMSIHGNWLKILWTMLGHPSFEPKYDKTNKITEPSKDSDQTGHPTSLISVFAARVAMDPLLLQVDSNDWSDSLLPRLIWVLAGCACHYIGFVMLWLFILHASITFLPGQCAFISLSCYTQWNR